MGLHRAAAGHAHQEQQREVIQARHEHAKELRRRQRAATKAARTRLAPMTATEREPAEVSRPKESELDVARARSLTRRRGPIC